MDVYHIRLRKPFNVAILKSHLSSDLIPCKENDSYRAKREGVGNRLEALVGEKPEWDGSAYEYTAILNDKQVEDIKKWLMVKEVAAHLR